MFFLFWKSNILYYIYKFKLDIMLKKIKYEFTRHTNFPGYA